MELHQLLQRVVDKGASDLHLGIPSRPILRIHGSLVVQEDLPPMVNGDIAKILSEIASAEQLEYFREQKELDFAYSVPGIARFRVNVLRQRGTLSIAFRMVPFKIPSMEDLGLPEIMKQVALKRRGLVLVTGQTGTGKSSTLAAMVNYINEHDSRNIITIEEPVEFLHQNKKCIISQREVGHDTDSFDKALVFGLRHDPDVLVVGEMRDLKTISTAITAAETGHLVLGTLHTYNAPQSIDRIIDIFPHEQQQQIRVQLSQIIEAVFSQNLVQKIEGGRVAVVEIMLATPAIRHMIREDKVFQLHSQMSMGNKEGMQTIDQALAGLVSRGKITRDIARLNCENLEEFEKLLAKESGII